MSPGDIAIIYFVIGMAWAARELRADRPLRSAIRPTQGKSGTFNFMVAAGIVFIFVLAWPRIIYLTIRGLL